MHLIVAAIEVAMAFFVVGVYLHVRDENPLPEVVFFDVMVVTATLYVLFSAAVLVTVDPLAIVFNPIRDVLKLAVPWAMVAFAVRLTGNEDATSREGWNVLLGVLVLGALFPLTNSLHGWVYAGLEPGYHGGPRLVRAGGSWVPFVLTHAGFGLGITLVTVQLLASEYVRASTAAGLMVALLVVTPVDLVSLLAVEPLVGFTVTPLVVLGVVLVVIEAMDRHDLFYLTPVSRSAVLDATDDAVFVVRRWHLVDYNETAEPFLTHPDPIGRPLPPIVRDELRALIPRDVMVASGPEDDALSNERRDDGVVSGEITVDIDGENRHYDVRTDALGGDLRPPARRGPEIDDDVAIIVLRDVTELKRQEAELRRKNEQLNTFTDTVAHDLRNPIAVAKGYLDMAGQNEDALEHVRDAVERMESMVEDLLELAKQGQSIGSLERVDLAETATDAWKTVDAPEATLTVEGRGVVEADRERLESLLENLFRNAVDHGSADVTVTVGTTDDGFYVADDGPGIPESERDDVFDHGYTTSEDGTGFGLSIVAEIATAHGWEVAVGESETGGARFDLITAPTEQPESEQRATND